MRLLVTGGCGFIGSNFIRYCLEKYDDEIVNLDSLTYAGNPENLKGIKGKYEFIKGDISNANDVKEAMTGCDTVVNFAAETHVDRSIAGPAVFIKTNIIGTQVLLDQAIKFNIKKFHHVSTDEVFGSLELDSAEKFNEKTQYNPKSPYSASKAASDFLVNSYHNTYGLPITISNCSNNFGPYQYPEKIIPFFITNILQNKKVPVYGDGLNVRDWLHVHDHCNAIDMILKKGKNGESYCIGCGNEFSNIEITRKILKILGKPESMIEFVADRPGHDRRYAIDATKIIRELGWKPESNFEDELKSTIDWYRNNEWWWRPLISG